MKINKYILSFIVGIFVFATLADISKVLISYSIYYYEYNQAKEACMNEKPDMFQSGKLFLKALMKRVNDICPNSKPKPPIVENSNIVLYVNNISSQDNKGLYIKLKNRFVYKFNYYFLNQKDIFHPPTHMV